MMSDQLILLWIQAHQTPFIGVVMRTISRYTGPNACLILAVVTSIGLVLLEKNWRKPAMFISGITLGGCISSLLKIAFARPRPPLGASAIHSYSFPSGHAFMNTILWALLAWAIAPTYSKRGALWKGLAIWTALMVGLSRIYLSVHWTTDVLGGWLLGGFFVYLWLRLWKPHLEERIKQES